MKVQYLEIVTREVDAVCAAYAQHSMCSSVSQTLDSVGRADRTDSREWSSVFLSGSNPDHGSRRRARKGPVSGAFRRC
jgi:hypothetical protein